MFSVVVSTRNEARNLPRCLECLRGLPEVVVVDSGSTDGTPELAERAGARVVRFQWDGRFPKKRNWTLRNVKLAHPWVLFLDADEFVSRAFLEEARRALEGTTHDGFWLRYENWFMGRRLRHGDVLLKLALIRVGAGEYERIDEEQWSSLDMEVHEHPVLAGTTGALRTPIEHNDFKGLHAYIAKHNDYSSWEARRYRSMVAAPDFPWERLTRRQLQKYRNLAKWWFAPGFFLAAYFLRRGFLDGWPGFVLALHKSLYFFQVRLKIRELA